MQTVMSIAGMVLAGLGLAWLGFMALRDVIGKDSYRHLETFRQGSDDETGVPSLMDKLEGIAGRIVSLDEWEHRLHWAQRNGAFEGKRIGHFALQSLVLGGAGLAFVLLVNRALFFWLIPLIGFVQPWVRLYSVAEDAKDDTVKELPAIASLVAAELAAGTPPEEAVRRAATLPGPLSGLLEDALLFARKTGRPLFAPPTAPVQGALVEVFTRVGIPQLSAFARQLNMVAVKGMEGAMLMSSIAEALADDYQATLERQLEQLDSRVWPVIAVFFFFPFVILLLVVYGLPAIQAMGM